MKSHSLYSLLLALALLLAAGCSDDVVTKTPLPAPTLSGTPCSVSSLNFTWQPVAGASQYAYELCPSGSDEKISGGITSSTSLLATGLKPQTAYTLSVWAYAPVTGCLTTSPAATLEAVTPAVTPLEGPVPNVVTEGSTVTVAWPAVEHAAAYAYSLLGEGGTLETTTVSEPCAVFRALEAGTYTLTITALSDDENFSDSPAVSVTFNVERQRQLLWQVSGSYVSAVTGTATETTLTAYDDGSYALEAPYGTATTTLEFLVTDAGAVSVTNHYTEAYGYRYLLTDNGMQWGIYDGEGYSAFEGDADGGEIGFYTLLYDADGNLLGEGYDDFTWKKSADPEPSFIDTLCGTYTETTSCYEAFSGAWEAVEGKQAEVSIAKVDDDRVSITNFYGWEDTFTASVDAETRTLTMDIKDDWGGYYTFAHISDPTVPVVATVDADGTITFSDWTAWYVPYAYAYIYEGAVSVLVRKP